MKQYKWGMFKKLVSMFKKRKESKVFKVYESGRDAPSSDCFCHFGWEGTGSFAFFKYAEAYYDSARLLFEKFQESKGNFAILDGIGLSICFLYRQYIELTLKYLYFEMSGGNDEEKKMFLEKGHDLNSLWGELKPILVERHEKVGTGENIDWLEDVVLEFHTFDHNSMAMRYPVSKKLKPLKTETWLDVVHLHSMLIEVHRSFKQIDSDLNNIVTNSATDGEIEQFQLKYEELKKRLVEILRNLKTIDEHDKDLIKKMNALEILQSGLWENPFEDCSDDELIMLDVLYYCGQAVRTGTVHINVDKELAKKDFISMCLSNLQRDKLSFGNPKNGSVQVNGKAKDVIIQEVEYAMNIMDQK